MPERAITSWQGDQISAEQVAENRRRGMRGDGTQKASGFLGEWKRPDGGISTELSVGLEIGGKEMEVPSMVPTLTRGEVDHLIAGKRPTDQIYKKAAEHATMRMNQGKSPFASDNESIIQGQGYPDDDLMRRIKRGQ